MQALASSSWLIACRRRPCWSARAPARPQVRATPEYTRCSSAWARQRIHCNPAPRPRNFWRLLGSLPCADASKTTASFPALGAQILTLAPRTLQVPARRCCPRRCGPGNFAPTLPYKYSPQKCLSRLRQVYTREGVPLAHEYHEHMAALNQLLTIASQLQRDLKAQVHAAAGPHRLRALTLAYSPGTTFRQRYRCTNIRRTSWRCCITP